MRVFGAALLAGIVAALIHVPRLDAPLEASHASAAASYQVLFNRNWDEAGFAALVGIPCVGIGGEDVLERRPYLHHPVLSYWLSYAVHRILGKSERALRLVPMVATVLSAVVTTLLLARFFGVKPAILAGMVFAALPLSFAFGSMPNPEASVVLFLLLGFWLWERARERPTASRRWIFHFAFFVGCFVDWQVYFLFPALLLAEVLRPSGTRRFGPILALLPIGSLALVLTLSHFAYGLGSVAPLYEHIIGTAQMTFEGKSGRSLDGLVENQLEIVALYVGWPIFALFAGFIACALIRPASLRSDPGRLLLPLVVPFLCNQGFFRSPAYDHHFYWMPLLVALPFALTGLCTSLEKRSGMGFLLASALIGGTILWLDVHHDQRAFRNANPAQDYPLVASLVDRFATPEDLVLTADPVGPAIFYAKTRLYDGVRSVDALSRILFQKRHWAKLYFYLSDEAAPDFAELLAFCERKGRRIPHPKIHCFDLSEAQLDETERERISK